MDTVTQGTSLSLDLEFTDQDDGPVTPTSASYRIQDQSGAEVLASTPFAPAGATHTLEIPGNLNGIVTAGAKYERKRVTVTFAYGGVFSGSNTYDYTVRNADLVANMPADQCLLEGYLSDVGGINAPGVKVSVTPTATAPLFVDDRAVKRAEKFATTDSTGFFSRRVLKGTPVRIRCAEVGFDKIVTLTESIVDWSSL